MIRIKVNRGAFHPPNIGGAPPWVASEQFVIEGKPPAASTAGNDVARQRLQRLLAERFHLALRRETKEGPIYALRVWKGGHKMRESDKGFEGFRGMPGQLAAEKVGMDQLAKILSMRVGRTVVDRTGLKGTYAFQLASSDEAPKGATPAERMKADEIGAPLPDANGPSLFTALQEQLGLKLEPAKGPIETIVIERIERPTAN